MPIVYTFLSPNCDNTDETVSFIRKYVCYKISKFQCFAHYFVKKLLGTNSIHWTVALVAWLMLAIFHQTYNNYLHNRFSELCSFKTMFIFYQRINLSADLIDPIETFTLNESKSNRFIFYDFHRQNFSHHIFHFW